MASKIYDGIQKKRRKSGTYIIYSLARICSIYLGKEIVASSVLKQ